MQNKATDLFSDWAEVGRDKGMADAHDPAVSQILDKILKDQKTPFTFIDAGCGRGKPIFIYNDFLINKNHSCLFRSSFSDCMNYSKCIKKGINTIHYKQEKTYRGK